MFNSKKYHCIVKSNSPTQLWIADKPPLCGGKIEQIAVVEVEKKLNFSYTEALWIEQSFVLKIKLLNEIKLDKNFSNYQSQLRAFLNAPLTERLVLSPILHEPPNPNVGWGVFARQPIKMGDIVAIYSGIVEEERNLLRTDSHYLMNYGPQDNPFAIDAKLHGGIGRFFQHAPISITEMANQLHAASKNPELRKLMVEMSGTTMSLEEARNECQYQIPTTPQDFFEMIQKKQSREPFVKEFNNLSFMPNYLQETVAWANLNLESTTIDGFPVQFFLANRNIDVGEQLLFNYYGSLEANNQEIALFTKQGRIFPRKNYQRQYIYVAAKQQGPRFCMPYDKTLFFEHDLDRQFPIATDMQNRPHSFFWIRKKLVAHNVIDERYSPLKALNTFALMLKEILIDLDIEIELYSHNPQKDVTEGILVDVVCTTKTRREWVYLVNIIKPFLQTSAKYFENTHEIVFRSVNEDTEKFHEFILKLPMLRKQFVPIEEMSVAEQQIPENAWMLYFINQPGRKASMEKMAASLNPTGIYPRK